jgi:hypothetical protein
MKSNTTYVASGVEEFMHLSYNKVAKMVVKIDIKFGACCISGNRVNQEKVGDA